MVLLNQSSSKNITAVHIAAPITIDPADPAWELAPETKIDLTKRLNESGARISFGQDEERHVKVKALHNGNDIFFLYRWAELKPNIEVDDYDLFVDAFAMEIPLINEDSLLCMGSMDKPVNIIMWRADLPVPENIISGGGGTVQTSHDGQNIRHFQRWDDGIWNLIITRPMAAASPNQVSFKRGASYKIAFANWKGGSYGERGGTK